MLVSKRKYDFLLDRYEQFTSRADLLECQLADLNGALKKDGGPYKCVLECRGATIALSSPGCEPTWQTLECLAFVDRWISGLLPVLTHQISIQEWQEMLNICSVDHVYGILHRQSQGETR